MTSKHKSGFTLMELIIVMTLLAILAAVIVPLFLNTTDRARLRSDIASARVIQNALDLYRVERGSNVAGATIADQITNLATAGYLNSRNATIQTEGASWVRHNTLGIIVVSIQNSPQNVHEARSSLPPAEQEMVITGP